MPGDPEAIACYMMDQACQVTAVDALFNGESGDHAEVVYGMLSTSLGKKVVAHMHTSMDGAGGLSGDMQKLTLTCEDGSQVPVVVKRTREAGVEQSKMMGLAREGLFYQTPVLMERMSALPEVYFSAGDMVLGKKTTIMEDLSASGAVQCGYYFGPNSPHNYGKDLAALTAGVASSQEEILAQVATLAAEMHGENWGDVGSFESLPWLKSAAWYHGEGRQAWDGGQAYTRQVWAKVRDGDVCSGWDPELRALIDSSIDKGKSWEGFQASLKEEPCTLIHSDFHPANLMIRTRRPVALSVRDYAMDEQSSEEGDTEAIEEDAKDEAFVLKMQARAAAAEQLRASGTLPASKGNSDNELVVLDFELVGLGSGAQDLGQFLISHSSPADRERTELPFLQQYHAALTTVLATKGVDTAVEYPFDTLLRDYALHGAGKWIWLLVVMSDMESCKPIMPYFHAQVLAFVRTHSKHITVDTIGAPRL